MGINEIVKEAKELAEKMKLPRIGPLSICVPDNYAKEAANLYADQNVIVHTNNGSMYQYGVQIKQPGTHIDLRRLNEKIAAMELPHYVKQLQVLTPEEKKVYLLGEWSCAEEGE